MAVNTKNFYSTNKTGLLENLNTNDKNSLVGAINEINLKVDKDDLGLYVADGYVCQKLRGEE